MPDRNCACEKCGTYEPKRVKNSGWISPKVDGVRVQHLGNRMYSRDDKVYQGLEHLIKRIDHLPFGLDCEGYIDGMGFDEVSGLFRNYNQVPEAKLFVFDIHSVVQPIEYRYQRLRELDIWCDDIVLAPRLFVANDAQVQSVHKAHLKAGYEGSVFYKPNTFYKHNCRSQWFRIVPDKSMDLECIGFYEGEGKFKGMLGGVVFNKSGIEIKVGTGKALNDATRHEIWQNQYKYVGRVGQITYKSEFKSGKLRQARLDGWRDDKQPDYR